MSAGKDFSEWLASGRGSDFRLRVVIVEEQQPEAAADAQGQQQQDQEQEAPAAKRRRTRASAAAAAAAEPPAPGPTQRVLEDMTAHSVVLEEASGWARALLGSPESHESQQRSLDLVVASEAEGAAARLLITALYSADAAAALQGQPQLTLLQVLQLADRLQAPRGVAAAAAALAAAPLDWGSVLAIWQLPGGCADIPAYAAAYDAAAAAVQEQLGDLDAALADASKRARLRALPLPALLRLLRSDETRTSSENVVFHICSAARHSPRAVVAEGSDEEAALAACVRQQHISKMYHASVVCASPWFMRHSDGRAAAVYHAAPESLQQVLLSGADYAAFRAPQRPASAVTKGSLHWVLPLADIKAWIEGGCISGAAPVSPSAAFGGYGWHILLSAKSEAVGLSVEAYNPPGCCAPGAAAARTSVRLFSAPQADGRRRRVLIQDGIVTLPSGAGFRHSVGDFFAGCSSKQFDESAWRSKGYVSEGDAVRIRFAVDEVF